MALEDFKVETASELSDEAIEDEMRRCHDLISRIDSKLKLAFFGDESDAMERRAEDIKRESPAHFAQLVQRYVSFPSEEIEEWIEDKQNEITAENVNIALAMAEALKQKSKDLAVRLENTV